MTASSSALDIFLRYSAESATTIPDWKEVVLARSTTVLGTEVTGIPLRTVT